MKVAAREKVAMIVGALVIVLAVGGGVIGGLYWLAVLAGEIGARWWAVAATLALPAAVAISWRLATNAAREHLAGFDRGLAGAQKTVETMGRSLSATASLVRTARVMPRQAQSNDDLLHNPRAMQIVEAQRTSQVVEI